MGLREFLNKYKSLNKSTSTEKVEDNVYKQKEGYVSSMPKQDLAPKPNVDQFKKINTKIMKPMNLKGLPMLNRHGNTSLAERTIDGKPTKPIL